MEKIFEQDLEPIQGEAPVEPAAPMGDADLEDVPTDKDDFGSDDMGEQDYQYILTVKQQEESEGDANLEPEFTFVLTPKEEEGEETEDELEAIEDTSAGIEGAQAPAPSVAPAPAPLPESVLTDLEPIMEQEAVLAAAGGENTAPPAVPAAPEALPPAEEPIPEGEGELEEAEPIDISEEDLKGFLEGSDVELKFSIDEETEFTLEEAVDYLKLYPDTEVYVTVGGDIEEFKEKLDEFLSGKESATEEATTEEQNMMVDNEGESLDLKNTPQANPATPEVQSESFSIFNFKNKKTLPDGIYIGHLKENKLYGRIDIKLTADKVIIDKEIFELTEKINIAEAKDKEDIELTLKESEVERFVKLLEDKADIKVKL